MGARTRRRQPATNPAAASPIAAVVPPSITEAPPVARAVADRAWLYPALFAAVLLLAAGLRLYRLGSNPPELFEDEISGAASAWAIVTTGRDVDRTWLPFLVTKLEMNLPIYGLSTLPWQALLGHTAWAARLPAAIFGILSAALVVVLLRRLGRGRAEALLAGALFAALPWAVHYGRIGWEPAAALPFTLGGLALFWAGLEARRDWAIVAGVAVLALGFYAYDSASLLHPLLAAIVLALFLPTLRRRDFAIVGLAAACALVLLLPYIRVLLTEPFFTQRTARISIFRDGVNGAALDLGWRNYWAQWSPRWLFLDGPQNLRNQPGMAEAFPWMAPFFGLGICRAIGRRARADWFLLLWLVLGALPAGLADDGVPHYTRGLLALPPFVMLTAAGVLWCWEALRARGWKGAGTVLATLLVTLALAQGWHAYRFYFTAYPAQSASAWYYGTSAALRGAGAVVPGGGTLCVAGVSPFTFPHQVAWSLEPRDFTVIEGVRDARCARAGTYILERAEGQPQPSLRVVAITNDYEGKPYYRLGVRP